MKYKIRQLENKHIHFNLASIYIFLFAVIMLSIFLYRLVRGADMTDETFYATLAYRLAKGNHLLTDMWEQCSTAAVLPSILLKIRHIISGNFEGTILFFRLAFLVFNSGATLILFHAQTHYLNKKYAALLSLFYFFYAPFHMYTFSYNHLADMLIMLVINVILLAIEKRNEKLFLAAGCLCAFLAFTYPTMLFLCPIMALLLLLGRKRTQKGWLYFMAGGISFAVIALVVLLSTIGISGIMTGIHGIFSDPAYNIESLPISKKLLKAVQYLFTPPLPILEDRSFYIQIYFGWLVIVFFLKKKLPILKLSLGLYPIVVCMALFPVLQATEALGIAMFIFYLSLPCPFLILFTQKHKRVFCKSLYFEWLPVMLFYFVISVSSHGGAVQAVQGLSLSAFVMLKETVYILDETFEELNFDKANWKLQVSQWTIIFVLSIAIISEMHVYYNTVYRDGHPRYLTEKIETGPYKGIYTTIERKIYLEEMTRMMAAVQEEEKSVCVLYQTNFVYLMLDDMRPAAPTTWGIYPHIDNQNVYYEYFKLGKEHIPEIIFIVDVPAMYNYCGQREEYYEFCSEIKALIADNYTLTENLSIYETGCIRKYVLASDNETFQESLERIFG